MTVSIQTSTLLANLPPPLPPPEIEPSHLSVDSLKVVARLRRHGHTAYLVGGCVRDLLVGAHPKDYDVATSAHPEQIREIFRNSRLIGRRFRLAHVFFPDGNIIEVATFRSNPIPDAEAGSEEQPIDLLLKDDNQFGTAEEDAVRRDFTVNGLFYDVVEGRVIDFVGGREDLRKRSIRTIGDPEIRLREDPVRGLRAARIAAKLGFSIEADTFAAMQRHAGELPRCAPARILEETLKILRSGTASPAFAILRKAEILHYLLPAIEDVLVQGGPEAETSLLKRLSALDALVSSGESVTDAVMLASLLSFLPMHELVKKPGAEAEAEDEEEAVDDLSAVLPSADHVLSEMSAHARLPRRVADRVRAIIGSQRVFHMPVKKKRRRSGGFVRTPHFGEALQLFEIGVRATGQHMDVFLRWQQRAAASHSPELGTEPVVTREAPVPAPAVASAPAAAEEPPTEGEAAAKKKKRRRRGGRGRSKGPKPEGSPEGDGQPT
jgi:poly(A) polymerase